MQIIANKLVEIKQIEVKRSRVVRGGDKRSRVVGNKVIESEIE